MERLNRKEKRLMNMGNSVGERGCVRGLNGNGKNYNTKSKKQSL